MATRAPSSPCQAAFADTAPLHAFARDFQPRRQGRALQLGQVRIEECVGPAVLAAPEEPVCRLIFQPAAVSSLRIGEKHVDLHAPSWLGGMIGKFDVANTAGGMVALSFPVDQLSRSLSMRLQCCPFAVMPVEGASHMCLELIRSCLAQPGRIGEAVADALGDSLTELAKLALVEQFCTARGETVRETVRTRIQSFIQRNLADPDLTIERIAGRMKCTKRYLHKVFSEEGETLSQYIWSRRLELCRNRLSRRELAHKSITEIAFSSGFSNAAHFSRSFRARFGENAPQLSPGGAGRLTRAARRQRGLAP